MTTGAIIRLILLAAVFLVWAGHMYWMLAKISRRDREKTGGALTTTGGFMNQLNYFMASDEDKSHRKNLLFMTVILIFMVVSRALL